MLEFDDLLEAVVEISICDLSNLVQIWFEIHQKWHMLSLASITSIKVVGVSPLFGSLLHSGGVFMTRLILKRFKGECQ